MKITNTKIILVAILFLLVSGSAAAYDQSCTTPEAQMIREAVQTGNKQDPTIQAKLAGLPVLEKLEARICALQKLTPDEIATIAAQKQAMAGNTVTPGADAVPPAPTLGIQDPIDQTILGQGFVLGTNSWKGYIDGTLTAVTGTAEYDNPSQGVLFIWEPDNFIGSTRTYLAPTATGPLKIVSQQNDVLTIQSVAGTYEVYDINTDTRKYVTTKGGATYFFVLPTRKFEQ